MFEIMEWVTFKYFLFFFIFTGSGEVTYLLTSNLEVTNTILSSMYFTQFYTNLQQTTEIIFRLRFKENLLPFRKDTSDCPPFSNRNIVKFPCCSRPFPFILSRLSLYRVTPQINNIITYFSIFLAIVFWNFFSTSHQREV